MNSILNRCRWNETCRYISEKEHERMYPLNQISDMSVIINISPVIAHLVFELTRKDSNIWNNNYAFSTSRLFRIYMSTLIAVAITRSNNLFALEAAQTLIDALEIRIHSFPTNQQGPAAASNYEVIPLDSRRILHLLVLAREVADRIGFGDHTMCAHAPVPIQLKNGQFEFSEALFFQDHLLCTLPKLYFCRSGFKDPLPLVDVFRGKFINTVKNQDSVTTTLAVNVGTVGCDIALELQNILHERLLMEDSKIPKSIEKIAFYKAKNYIKDLSFYADVDDKTQSDLIIRQNANLYSPNVGCISQVFCELVTEGEKKILRRE